ncbi:MAG: hydrogenase maturation nickel metallochaperone HypA [Promethearchaeota archaeon]
MHEFSTAVSIVEAVKRAAKSYGATKVVKITLQIGQLSMLNHDQLVFGIEMASKDTIVEGAEITIEPLTTRIRCRQCSTESDVTREGPLYEILSSLACSNCNTKDVEVIQGRECIIKDIQAEVEQE